MALFDKVIYRDIMHEKGRIRDEDNKGFYLQKRGDGGYYQ